MKLGVYSLQKILFEGDVKSFTCTTQAGDITVLGHHEPLITLVGEGVMKIIDTKNHDHYVPTRSGFLRIDADNTATILVEEGEG